MDQKSWGLTLADGHFYRLVILLMGIVPTGTPNAHGGGHWDGNRKDGKGYMNVYPGGRTRPGKGKMPVLPGRRLTW